jgi:HEPN domain-containing protein
MEFFSMANADAMKFLKLAQGDLDEALRTIELKGFRPSTSGFLLQQAAEKALKAWLYEMQGVAPFLHDIAALLEALEAYGVETEPFSALVALNQFAVQYRYEQLPQTIIIDLNCLANLCSQLVTSVERLLGAER